MDGLSLPHHEEKREAVAVQQQNVSAEAMQANMIREFASVGTDKHKVGMLSFVGTVVVEFASTCSHSQHLQEFRGQSIQILIFLSYTNSFEDRQRPSINP